MASSTHPIDFFPVALLAWIGVCWFIVKWRNTPTILRIRDLSIKGILVEEPTWIQRLKKVPPPVESHWESRNTYCSFVVTRVRDGNVQVQVTIAGARIQIPYEDCSLSQFYSRYRPAKTYPQDSVIEMAIDYYSKPKGPTNVRF